MKNPLFQELCRLYETELRLLIHPVCAKQCDATIKNPLVAWHVGTDFHRALPRVLFVGKPHRGIPGAVRSSGVIDPRRMVEEDLRHRSWPYWSYTREIAARIFGTHERGWDQIALTNIIKCTNVDAGWDGAPTGDTTTRTMAECCVSKLGVISHEILLLRPTHVVFYTGGLWPELLEELAPFTWRGGRPGHVPCGAKRLFWWEREADGPQIRDLKVLITGHPERMRKEDYVGLIASWIHGA
jgi:hypothetical protein